MGTECRRRDASLIGSRRSVPGGLGLRKLHCVVAQFVVALAALLLWSCSTPQVVKDLSTAQLQAQDELRKQLGKYFEVMEVYVSTQIDAANAQIDELTDANIANRRKLAVTKKSIKKHDDQALIQLSDGIENDVAQRASRKAQLQNSLAIVKAKHEEFRAAYQVLYEAQEKLNQYIQLEKADERVVRDLLVAVGISEGKLTDAVDDLGVVTRQLSQSNTSAGELEQ